jgi:hypothetical protein
MVKVIQKIREVDHRLQELGLTSEILRLAVRAGELERVSCTELDPRSYPGTAAWALTIRSLREQLLPLGCRYQNKKNLPLIIDPVRRLAFVVTSGSSATGDPTLEPTTKYPKGPVVAGQIRVNRQQLTLFGDSRFAPLPLKEETITWLLLIRVEYRPKNETAGEHVAFCELSLPSEINEKGFVTSWAERIILEPVKLDQPRRRDDDDDEVEFDVPVTRRK